MVPSYFEFHLAKNPFLTFYLLQSSVSYWNKSKDLMQSVSKEPPSTAGEKSRAKYGKQ